MSPEEVEASQSGDDGGMGGPGAPTPLSALEVSFHIQPKSSHTLSNFYTRESQVLPREISK